METWSKIGPFGAKDGTPVDIASDAPIKLNKLEAWTDDTQGIISGIQFTYTDKKQGPLSVTSGKTTGTYHCLFDNLYGNRYDYVVNLYGNAGANVVHKLGVKTSESPGDSCGREIGKGFEIPVASGSIVAFFGFSDGQALNAVGAYVVPRVAP